MSITTRHRIAARERMLLNLKRHIWAARGALERWIASALVSTRRMMCLKYEGTRSSQADKG